MRISLLIALVGEVMNAPSARRMCGVYGSYERGGGWRIFFLDLASTISISYVEIDDSTAIDTNTVQ